MTHILKAQEDPDKAPLTGRKVLYGTVSAFAIIVSVNLILAYFAIKTFPGVEVRNSNIVSQNFDADRDAQLALGWTVSADVMDEELHLNINDADGRAVEVAQLDAIFGRATSVRDDQTPEFRFTGTTYIAAVITAPGNWIGACRRWLPTAPITANASWFLCG